MSLQRLRRGEAVVLLGLAGLIVSSFLRWFDFERLKDPDSGASVFGSTETGWGYLGAPWVVLLVLVGTIAVAALVTAARAGARRPTYGAVSTLVVGVPLVALALVLLAVRLFLATPTPALSDLGSGSIVSTVATAGSRPDLSTLEADLSLAAGSWVGLVSVLAVLAGLWLAMSDDRSTAAESVAVPRPDVLPVPPLRAAPARAPVAEPTPEAPTTDAPTADAPTTDGPDPESPPAPWTPTPESPVPPDADEGPGAAPRPGGGPA